MITKSTNLTKSQMLIWMGQGITPEAPLYNMIFSFEIEGSIEVDAFKSAFGKLVGDSDVLRSVLFLEGDTPKLGFHGEIDNPLVIQDFSNRNDAYQAYLDYREACNHKVFGMGELLYQAILFKIHDTKFVFYLNQHHLITDARSTQNCYDTLNKYYQHILKLEPSSDLKESDFQRYAETHLFQEQEFVLPFWQTKLQKSQEQPSLYGNKGEEANSKATRIYFDLGKNRTAKLHQLSLDDNLRSWTPELTLSNLFLTALSVLVYKVGSKKEFAVGVPFHNRTNTGEKDIIGLLMELLPTGIEVEEEATLLSLYQYLKNESLDVVKNAMSAKPPIALLRSFNVVMNFTPTTFNDFAGLPTECHWLFSDHVDPNHHIRLQIHDFNDTGSFQLIFDFNQAVFSKNRMNLVVQHFINIMDAMLVDMNQTVRDLSIITETETQTITEWNSTTHSYDSNETLLVKFEKQVKETPNARALLFKGQELTYAQLDERANQMAHFLMAQGIPKNSLIAVSLERSMEMMVSIYGILKAGAAYLPIDVSTPPDRLKFILESAEATLLLYNHDQLIQHNIGDTRCHDLRDIDLGISDFSTTKPEVSIVPDDLAYVIYTSGSTGRPKGVKCHHKGICNRLNWMNGAYPIFPGDRLVQKTPITFDVSVWELFWPLQVGADLVILEPEEHKNPERLIENIVHHQITAIHFVPSMLNLFIGTESVDECQSLNRIFCSGEVLSMGTVKKAQALLKAEIYNLYGPTEASVDVSHWHCKRGEVHDRIPIGHPVPNTQLYILDEALNLAPIGAVGELYIAGVQVAQGYLNNKVLTEERFVKNIFSSDKHAVMYKTGDLARYREDGAIDYLGRIDTQIKLRGLRIELGEIEKTLENHRGVTQAIVQVAKTKAQEEYLVAYYTGEKLEGEDLREVLTPVLPAYMIPSFFMHVQQFELLSNGKVDRKSIPRHTPEAVQEGSDYEPPTNEFEKIIARTWMEVLQIDRVGLHENFIRLGGNSLNAMAITSRLKAAFELELPLTLVFEHPTVKSYATYVERRIMELLSS